MGKKLRRILLAGCAILISVLAAVVYFRPQLLAALIIFSSIGVPSPDMMYPPASTMPAVVSESVEDLLAAHEAFLKNNAPETYAALQPGLTDAEIDELEATHSIKLTKDLRALYRWRNGTPRNPSTDAFPDHAFVPFDEALAQRDTMRQDFKELSPEIRMVETAFVGHRGDWIDVIVDMSGDGYFFDPAKSEAEGSFFYCMAEDASFNTFYPAFRNYLASVVEGEKTGVFVVGPHGIEATDFYKAQALEERFGAAPEY